MDWRKASPCIYTNRGCIHSTEVAADPFFRVNSRSTIADIERHIGAVEEDEDDSLVIRDFPGLFFEIEGYFPDLQKDPAYRYAPIKEICVHTTPIEWHYFEPGTAMWT